jgi:hypothetical protein
MTSPQQTYDAAVSAANAEHQVATDAAAREFARYHAGMPEYEAARHTHATLTGIADATRNTAIAVAAAVLLTEEPPVVEPVVTLRLVTVDGAAVS